MTDPDTDITRPGFRWFPPLNLIDVHDNGAD